MLTTLPKEPNRPRAHPRIQVSVPVTCYDRGTRWSSVDLSEGGLFVQTDEWLPPGTPIEVGIKLDDPLESFELVSRAEVAWNNPAGADKLKPTLPAGMGLKFTGLDESHQSTLRRFLTRLLCTRHGREQKDREPQSHGCSLAELSLAPESEEESALAVGKKLGPYRIIALIGSGGMGNVYLAEHEQLQRRVALKRLHPRHARNKRAAQRFFEEARIVNQIRHDNIVEVTDLVAEGDQIYFVMELLDGTTLGDLLAEEGVLQVGRAIKIACQLADVLDAVHRRGIVHRDLKPDNIILISRQGHEDFVKLVDFGIAKIEEPLDVASPNKTVTGQVMGTPGYMAPEHFLGKKVDARTDIYGLGVVLYQMVTGRRPYHAPSWGELMLKQTTKRPPRPSHQAPQPLPYQLDRLIVRCLAKQPKKRPQSMLEVGQELKRLRESPAAVEIIEGVEVHEGRARVMWLTLMLTGITLVALALSMSLASSSRDQEIAGRAAEAATERSSEIEVRSTDVPYLQEVNVTPRD